MEKNLWDRMLETVKGGSDQAKAEKSYKNHPEYQAAQKKALEHYMKTGEERPLESFMTKPN